MPFLIDLRDHAADGDLSDVRHIGITLVGSVATMVDVHSILSGLECDAEEQRQDDPGRDTSLAVAALRLLREAVASDLLVDARLTANLANSVTDPQPASDAPPARPAARTKKEAG